MGKGGNMKNYFTIEELCKSDTAKACGIDNTPSPKVRENLQRLIDFINPIREAWGSAIRINSGFRCPQLNRRVGGSSTSAHLTGNAVDMYPINGKIKEFKEFVPRYLKEHNCSWDQCLREKSAFAEWVHLGLYSNSGQQRKQIKNLNV